MHDIATDGDDVAVSSNGQDWRVAWHPAPDPPAGMPHGASGLCMVAAQVVLVSSDGERWTLPGGRPAPGEGWVDTLRREVREEACAAVASCRLLGYTRGVCMRGHEQGLVLVRSHWRAEVCLDAWDPRFEMTHRRLVPADDAFRSLTIADDEAPIFRRIFVEAGISPAVGYGQADR